MDDEGRRDEPQYQDQGEPLPEPLDSTRADPDQPGRPAPATPPAPPTSSDARPDSPTRLTTPAGSAPESPTVPTAAAALTAQTAIVPGPVAVPGQPGAGPSGTSVLPTVPTPVEPPRWSARAQVRPPDAEPEPAEAYWAEEDDQAPRGILGPALIAIVALVLLGVLAVGVWLLLRGGSVTVEPSPSAAGTTAAPATTPPPRTTAAPTTTAPAPIPVPNLRGQDYATAAAVLTQLGLVPQRSDKPNATLPVGQVIDTDPPAGKLLAPGTTVVVSVSSGAPSPPPATTTPPPVSPS